MVENLDDKEKLKEVGKKPFHLSNGCPPSKGNHYYHSCLFSSSLFFCVVFYTVEMIPKESFKQESNPFMELYSTSQ